MRATTPKYNQILAKGNSRNFVVKIDLTLADDNTNPTVLHLTEADIWYDSFKCDTASSSTSSFDIGSAIIGQVKFSLNNFDERFNQYDFFNATAIIWVGLVGDLDENDNQVYYRLGFFTVDEPEFAGALIQLVCLDNMWKFDVPMISLQYPTTCLEAVLAICTACGVTLDQTEQFHGANFVISEAPERTDNMNCREFLQYVAMLGCNFCIITEHGLLKLRWYDTAHIPAESDLDGGTFNTDTTPYSDGDTADGGDFIDYSSADNYDGGGFKDNPNVAYFTRNFKLTVGTDVIRITGLKVVIDQTEYTIGEEGYRLTLENPLITESNVANVLSLIWEVLHPDNDTYFTLRTFNLTTITDVAPEVGDCCAIKDYKGNFVYSWITNITFAFSNQSVRCDAIPPSRTLVKQYSKNVQTAVEVAKRQTEEQIAVYDVLVQELNRLTSEAMGAFTNYEDAPTGGRYYYTSNMPITKNPTTGICSFEPNSVVFKLAGDVLSVSRDGGLTWQNGYDPTSGTLLVNVLDAIGINCDWIRSGTLTLGGINNSNGRLVMKDANNNTIGTWDASGLEVAKGSMRGLSMDLGGPLGDASYGELKLYDTDGREFAVFNQDGILCKSGDMRLGYKGILVTDLQYGQDWNTYDSYGHAWLSIDSDELTFRRNMYGSVRTGGLNLDSSGYLNIAVANAQGLKINGRATLSSGSYVKSLSTNTRQAVTSLSSDTRYAVTSISANYASVYYVCTDLSIDFGSESASWWDRELRFVDNIDYYTDSVVSYLSWDTNSVVSNVNATTGNLENGLITS